MNPAIHRSAPSGSAFMVPCPRATDAIGDALRGAYPGVGELPLDMIRALAALDRVGRA